MITDNRKLLPYRDQLQLLRNTEPNKKHHLLVLLMLDCGLRVTECSSLRIKNFDFAKQEIIVKSLKKRSDNPIFRNIPMTRRVQLALAAYYATLKDKSTEAFLFPTNSKKGHINRRRVTTMIQRKSGYKSDSHTLRHTFATRIVTNGNDIRSAQKLLGHKSQSTTEIYLHVPEEQKKKAIKSIDKLSIWETIQYKYFPKRIIKSNTVRRLGETDIIGRDIELTNLEGLRQKKVNTILLGSQGIGKSFILSQLQNESILRLDDFRSVKQTLANLTMAISEKGKNQIICMLEAEADIKKVVTKNSANRLIDLLYKICHKNEFTLIIDDVTDITKTAIRALEKLKNHFHIICAARRVKVDHASFLTNFERIEIKPLNRSFSYRLIDGLSKSFTKSIEDYDIYRNHVFDQSQGNPLFIREIIERLKKEDYITVERTRDIQHTAALKEIDMSMFVVICLSSLMVLRYIGGEFDGDSGAFRLFGGIFLVFALFARSLFQVTKRKYI